MKKRELINLGFERSAELKAAQRACLRAKAQSWKKSALRKTLRKLTACPEQFLEDPLFEELARMRSATAVKAELTELRADLTYNSWGTEIDPAAHEQMQNACSLPVAVSGALMPDAHLGYGLPIGGVLAVDNAVIPYAVGVDIACRVKLSVIDMPLKRLNERRSEFRRALEENCRFGIGAAWKQPKEHSVMDESWPVGSAIKGIKDLAWKQLGTSGSGNHFVEFGELELLEEHDGRAPGTYLAVVSHSGSRGPGAKIAAHYSRLAQRQRPQLPGRLKHLAWLGLDEDAGAEYWAAMELMGRYASANHQLIHSGLLLSLGAQALFQVENHHNFAWRERHHGREVIVHRKGATPAAPGELGYIPGSMVAPGYLVKGLGNPASLFSCSHGAGRQMSRRKAKNTTTHNELRKVLRSHGVELISAGLDESPHAYKNIDEVMEAQKSLVRRIARFLPKLVKMAPDGEKPED